MSCEGSVLRTSLPGMHTARIQMCAGDHIQLHDHPWSSVYMYVVEGQVEMQVFKLLERDGDEVTLQWLETFDLGADQHAALPAGDSCFHTVTAKSDCIIIDAFSVCDDVDCVSVFYKALSDDLMHGPFKAVKIPKEEAEIPHYFKEEYASSCP